MESNSFGKSSPALYRFTVEHNSERKGLLMFPYSEEHEYTASAKLGYLAGLPVPDVNFDKCPPTISLFTEKGYNTFSGVLSLYVRYHAENTGYKCYLEKYELGEYDKIVYSDMYQLILLSTTSLIKKEEILLKSSIRDIKPYLFKNPGVDGLIAIVNREVMSPNSVEAVNLIVEDYYNWISANPLLYLKSLKPLLDNDYSTELSSSLKKLRNDIINSGHLGLVTAIMPVVTARLFETYKGRINKDLLNRLKTGLANTVRDASVEGLDQYVSENYFFVQLFITQFEDMTKDISIVYTVAELIKDSEMYKKFGELEERLRGNYV